MESPRRLPSIAERKKLLGLCNESNLPQGRPERVCCGCNAPVCIAV